MGIAEIILSVFASYAFVGAIVGIAFVTVGVARVDHAASGKGAPWSFRLLIWPGAAALWPLVLMKWIGAARAHAEHTP